MSGRAASTDKRPGLYALSVGATDMPAPPGWRWVRLLDVARLESGHTPSRKVSNYWGGEFPWIGIKDAREHHGGVIHTTFQTVTQAGLDNSAARLLPPKTVCLSRTASVGYTLIMGDTMATSQDFVNWVCSDEIVPEFLMYLFLAEKESLLRFGKGTTHTTIYYPEVKAFHVCLPSPDEQRSIVSALDSYFSRLDDAVANLERVQRNLKRYRASVLKAAVEGRLVPTEAELARAEGRDYEPASVLLERILAERRRRWEEAELEKMLAKGKPPKNDKWKAKYKEPTEPDLDGLPELPEGWCWATLPQLVTADGHFVDGDWVESKDQDPGGEVRLTQLADVGDGVWRDRSARFLTTQKAGELRCTLLEADDVLIARMPDPLGRACLFPGADRPCVTVVDVCIVRLDRDYVSAKWLSHALNAPSSRARVKALERGSTRKRISRRNLGTIPIALPPRAEQTRVAAEIERLLTIAERVGRDAALQVEKLAILRQGLLASAFRGRLLMHDRVPTGTTQ